MTSTVKVNNVQASDGGNIINQCGTNITIGASGDTIALASGASQTGFGRSGSVNWQTTPKTSTFTAADGEGYFVNSGSALTMNLPAGSAGAIVAVSDYARNFETYNLTIAANGSEKIGGIADDAKLDINGQAATFVYVDSTKGWVNVQNAEDTETGAPPYITATGGTITTSGDYKIHTFTGPGTFTVCTAAGVCGPTRNVVSYLVAAGGGGAGGGGCGGDAGGGGGAGGFREYRAPLSGCYAVSPLNGNPGGTAVTVSATSYPITVGSGGAGGSPGSNGSQGANSIFSTVTSTGGGYGQGTTPGGAGDGGSGGGGRGGGGIPAAGGSGNTPPVSPAQGKNGGTGGSGTGSNPQTPDNAAGGGGGATAVGANAGPGDDAGDGGAGATSSIDATPTARAGGGGGSGFPGGAGGTGGGGAGTNLPSASAGTAGTVNTGGGGGGGKTGGTGGSGVVIIRYKYQ